MALPTRWILAAPLSFAMMSLIACNPGQGDERARARFSTCVPCHGTDGNGNQQLGAPPISGMPDWYIEAQLRKFKDGVRGAHPDDEAGLRMRPMARTLGGDEDIKALASFLMRKSHTAPAERPHTVSGDPIRGRGYYQTCLACHGERGAGNKVLNAPDLTHTADWYMLSQLRKFKDGLRGAHPQDVTGATMRAMIVSALPDEQSMRDVVAYIMTLEK